MREIARKSTATTLLLATIFVVGAAVRTMDFRRPIGTNILQSWREGDIASLARNYDREGMNLFYPRVDWRGDGPGYAEMEFPLYPWSIAVLYRIFGFNDHLGRVFTYLLSLITMGVFWRLARRLLPDAGALAAMAFFALSPLVVRVASALQAEGMMILFYLLGVYGFLVWVETGRRGAYWLGLVATSLAILAKIPAIHIGLLYAYLIVSDRGLKQALRQPRVWVFALGCVVPSLLWYGWANHFWREYGNSLGASNMWHWIGPADLHTADYWKGLVANAVVFVWMPAGVVVAILGALYRPAREAVRVCLAWVAAIVLYQIVTIRTNGASWGVYYHVVTVAPAALFFGAGTLSVAARVRSLGRLWTPVVALAAAGGVLAVAGLVVHVEGVPGKLFMAAASLLVAAGALPLLAWAGDEAVPPPGSRPLRNGAVLVVGSVCVAASVLFLVRHLYWDYTRPGQEATKACAEAFVKYVPEGTLIATSGLNRVAPDGIHLNPYNASYVFYWMDRKGFNVSIQDHNVAFLRGLARRGAKVFFAERWVLGEVPGFEEVLRATFPVIDECDEAILFRLSP